MRATKFGILPTFGRTAALAMLRPKNRSRSVAAKKFRNRKAKRSLRTILMIWFLLLSLVPMMFVTGYSLVRYEQAIDSELVQRLRANVREIASTVGEFEKYLTARRNHYKSDTSLIYFLSTNSIAQARAQVAGSVRNSLLSSLSLFNSQGQLVASLMQDGSANPKENVELENANLALSDSYKDRLAEHGKITIVDIGASNSMDLIALTRLDAKTGRLAGYVQEIINIGQPFLENIKKRLDGLEVILFDNKGNIIAGSHPDFLLYPKDMFAKIVTLEPEKVFPLTIQDQPYGFIMAPVKFGDGSFVIGLGASKQTAHAYLKKINTAFFTMIIAIGILLILSSILATRVIVRPIYDLVEAIQHMDVRDAPIEIPVSTETEIGVLTESFNEMSQRIYQAKGDLEKKIKELELAYSEVKDTQARLVHSAKMAGLGQLVAGIAHELNNPIGFIYSNMAHLKDYSDKLVSLVDVATKNPAKLEAAKEEIDFAYIIQDLPRLITSCEEGARRTRDIVLGLRNFSRLEEAVIKKVSLQEGIENTLRLLSGELKNRVRVHTDFEKVPDVLCYASQLNQVFMNILTNAAQAIESEGDIWISLRELKKSKGQPPRAQVTIRDSGKGMPSNVVEQIFDPFFTTKTVGQGTGLGMSISYGIVKKHGGDIQVSSEPGKGTEFIVTIPIAGPPGSESARLA